ncbi:SUF system Fe-S cluster assembly protein [Hyphobacterium sp. HN65]|uniref:SUF system Fe-S cluster assembly protein n=1 Tax=Hyphobacterium lacteum TaxID=3116575 RepID=A0ABU7LLM4_9PROT|nr:SUF system Fe-S cluster assembly protein [Hyphobacterium sp. HN65]MEE2524835.1 SUF system Fe-S cluster assembly protein [Hyphobacterium sp. HN65]
MTNKPRDIIDVSSKPEDKPAAAEVVPATNIPDEELERITKDVVEAMKTVFDPEIPVDIYELGLIYKVDLDDDRTLHIQMTLTAPGCPVAGEMPMWVHDAAAKVEGVEKVKVDLVFEPPWTPDRMTDEARLALNMF